MDGKIKYIDSRKATAALKYAAYGIEVDDAGGITVADLTRRIDDALRVVLGRETFDTLDDGPDEYDLQVDDEVDDLETPKF